MKKLVIVTTLALLFTFMSISQLGCGKEIEEPTAESNRWLELLRVLPANENTLEAAYLQDTTYLKEKKQRYPEISAEYEHVLIRTLPSLLGGTPNRYINEEWQQTLGFVEGDVDQMIYAYRSLPRDYYEAIQGRFSRDDIDNAVRTGPMNDVLEVFSYAGHEFYSWGTDYDFQLSRRSNVRPLGRGMRLALIDDFIFWVGLTESMKEMIDSYEDNIESLADLENYRLLAEGLIELDTVSAFITSESQAQSHIKEAYKDIIENPDNEARRLIAEQVQREVYLKPYQAFATGFGLDEKGYYLAIVLLNPDEDVSRENTAILEKQIRHSKISGRDEEWSDVIDSVEIRRNGRLTLAKLYGRCSAYWNNFDLPMMLYEPLLIHK